LPVTVERDGDPTPLPPPVELSAYRVIQEALTNTLRHAGKATATVCLAYRRHALEVTVTDDGHGPDESAGAGHGLIGMRERVTLLGGEFCAGRADGGGFVVRARFPVEPEVR
jgi:signal transduction histidine kinase